MGKLADNLLWLSRILANRKTTDLYVENRFQIATNLRIESRSNYICHLKSDQL